LISSERLDLQEPRMMNATSFVAASVSVGFREFPQPLRSLLPLPRLCGCLATIGALLLELLELFVELSDAFGGLPPSTGEDRLL